MLPVQTMIKECFVWNTCIWTSKDQVSEKVVIKCRNIIKRYNRIWYKKWLTLLMLEKKT